MDEATKGTTGKTILLGGVILFALTNVGAMFIFNPISGALMIFCLILSFFLFRRGFQRLSLSVLAIACVVASSISLIMNIFGIILYILSGIGLVTIILGILLYLFLPKNR